MIAPDDFDPADAPRFTVEKVLGSGGYGHVFLVHDREKGIIPVALKVLTMLDRPKLFLRERVTSTSLANIVNVVPVYEGGVLEEDISTNGLRYEGPPILRTGTYYLLMEHCPAGSLDARRQASRLTFEGRQHLSVEQVMSAGIQIARALQAAQKLSIAHRDVKPGNILVRTGGYKEGEGCAAVADFGISVMLTDAGLTSSPFAAFSLAYAPPEVIQRHLDRDWSDWTAEQDHRWDVYSLAATLYELLTGSLPYGDGREGDLRKLAVAETGAPPTPIPDALSAPKGLTTAIMRGLCVDPKGRFKSAGEMLTALQQARCEADLDERLEDVFPLESSPPRKPPTRKLPEPGPVPQPTPVKPWWSRIRLRYRIPIGLVAGFALVVLGVSTWHVAFPPRPLPDKADVALQTLQTGYQVSWTYGGHKSARDVLVAIGPFDATSLDQMADRTLVAGGGPYMLGSDKVSDQQCVFVATIDTHANAVLSAPKCPGPGPSK